MPTALTYRNTGLASVPEDALLEKQRSIKRSAHHRSSYSLPAFHLGESSRPGLISGSSGIRSYKGKGKEVVDRALSGEWVVNVNEMDIGLEAYGEKRRVILVIGGKLSFMAKGMLSHTSIRLRHAIHYPTSYHNVWQFFKHAVHLGFERLLITQEQR